MSQVEVDVLLVGAGVMSTTLGMMLKKIDPSLNMMMVERLDRIAGESSDGWNNAGTGHAAYCELNYTPRQGNTINADKAYAINTAFESSLQFWSYLVESDCLKQASEFIHQVPHMSFVWGEDNVNFLRERYQTMTKSHLFSGMEYSENPEQIADWIPLVMSGRADKGLDDKVACTRVGHGSDVDFGALTRAMVKRLQTKYQLDLKLKHSVNNLTRDGEHWHVEVEDLNTEHKQKVAAKFVFLGAGGGALPLLQKTGIPEAKGYGGFPVSGLWMECKDPEVVNKHDAKVYGLAAVGAPPMSVPHLDSRIINGHKTMLFGPYAGFSTKFLKYGSYMDLFAHLRPSNIVPYMQASLDNFSLSKYLIEQVLQSQPARMDALRQYFPEAQDSNWNLAQAGQRVQIIKKDPVKGGFLQFGTEVVSAADGSLAALLGASPGASTSVQTMVDVLERCFPEKMKTQHWQDKMLEMIPSYGQSLKDDAALLDKVRARTLNTLGLDTK